MNKFEIKFFSKYIPEDDKLLWTIHKHLSVIFIRLFFLLSITILPSFLFYVSPKIQELIPFYFLEIFLVLIYIKIIYDIFDWYNDVWLISDSWITDLQWSLFKKKTNSVNFINIEWLWVEQSWLTNSILKKWDLVIHKIWDDNFILEDVFLPFKKVELIEKFSEEFKEEEEEDMNTKFNTLVDALHWVIENFWHKEDEEERKKEELKKKIENIKNDNWTIDLR